MLDNMSLKETAETVRKLIAENPESVQKFHANSKLFQDQYDAYWNALKKAQTKAETNPDFKNYHGGTPPRKNMEWFSDPYNSNQRFWTVTLPFDPYGWISYYYDSTPWHPLKSDEKPKEPTEDERLMCEYVILGLIYDEVLEVPKSDRLCKIGICDLRSSIMTTINDGEKIKSKINLAIDHVKADLPGNDGQGETAITDYTALDLAKRTVTIGSTTYQITSEKVWDFIKDLCSAFRDDCLVSRFEEVRDNKNNVDQLRRQIGKDNLNKLIIFVDGGYKLNPEVKRLSRGQIGNRKTHLSRNRK